MWAGLRETPVTRQYRGAARSLTTPRLAGAGAAGNPPETERLREEGPCGWRRAQSRMWPEDKGATDFVHTAVSQDPEQVLGPR